jgi:hypothetical protein
MGAQINRAMTDSVKSGAADYVSAWASVLTPEVIRQIAAMGRRTGKDA